MPKAEVVERLLLKKRPPAATLEASKAPRVEEKLIFQRLGRALKHARNRDVCHLRMVEIRVISCDDHL